MFKTSNDIYEMLKYSVELIPSVGFMYTSYESKLPAGLFPSLKRSTEIYFHADQYCEGKKYRPFS